MKANKYFGDKTTHQKAMVVRMTLYIAGEVFGVSVATVHAGYFKEFTDFAGITNDFSVETNADAR